MDTKDFSYEDWLLRRCRSLLTMIAGRKAINTDTYKQIRLLLDDMDNIIRKPI